MNRFVLSMLCLGLVGCASQGGELDGEVSDTLEVKLGTLGEPCVGNPSSLNLVDTIRICGEGPISGVDGEGTVIRTLFDRVVPVSETLQLGDIPVNDQYEITVIGEQNGSSSYVGFVEDVSVSVGEVQELDIQWAPFRTTSCVSVESAGKPAHRVFSAGVLLPDGTFFFGGGFSALSSDGVTLKPGSTKTYLFDPATATLSSGPNIAIGRGGHAMVYVPSRQHVLVIGGASELTFDDSGEAMPFRMESTTALTQIEVIDFSGEQPKLLAQSEGDSLSLSTQRVFPRAVVTAGGDVLISGGYDWDKNPTQHPESKDFTRIEHLVSVESEAGVASWKIEQSSTGLDGDEARAGNTFDWVQDETNNGKTREVFLVWGGTRNPDRQARIVRSEDDGTKVAYPVQIAEGSAAITSSFFHSMTHLGTGKLLALGGVSVGESGRLSSLNSDQAYLIEYSDPNGVTPTLNISKIPGLEPGRYFHTAQLHPGGAVSAYGGFIDLLGTGASEIVSYNQNNSNALRILTTGEDFPARGGHLSVPLRMGATYLATGVGKVTDLTVEEEMLSQILVSPAFDLCESPIPQAGEGVE